MTTLSGSFETDLSLVDALSACAEGIEDLGWKIDSVDGRRIVAHPTGAGTQPTIEVGARETQSGSDIEISGMAAGEGSRDELVRQLDQARDAIRASVEKASHTEARRQEPARISSADAGRSREETASRSRPAREPPRGGRRPARWAARIDAALAVLGVLAIAACLLLPLHLLWLGPVVVGALLLIRRRWVLGVLVALLGVVLYVVSQHFIWDLYVTPTRAMEPTLHVDDHLAVSRVVYDLTNPKVGDVVLFHPPIGAKGNKCGAPRKPREPCPRPTPRENKRREIVKRIVAGPGDRISIRKGHAVVNGKIAKESFIRPCKGGGACNMPKPSTVPPGDYFVLGDNRGAGDDSRLWGPVPQGWFVGQVLLIYSPTDRIGFP
jgi:signal peptidase I